ncbi:solute carrier family 49 member A3-like isoform X2 [Tachypleus tridentatus]|uniref:solute carrier family 49 member A3-like isoform X2 n=1 Tax=Tachypleus tridentatus TaxID=6853 RepID=UPI003FD61CFA
MIFQFCHVKMEDIDNGNVSARRFRSNFEVYTRRWFILFVTTLLNISNAIVWVSYAPVAKEAVDFYHVSLDKVNWFSLVFFVSTVPFGLLAMWFIDKRGLRSGILIGAWVNALGISLRAFSTTSWIPSEYQYQFSLVGQSVASCAQPFVFFIPTKVAEKWFPEHQRALATTIIGMANPVGMMIATASASSLLSVQCTFSGIPLMNLVWSVPAIICVLLATFGVCSSTPPTPPSSSAAVITHQPYSQGIRELLIGWCSTIMIGSGLIGSLIIGVIVDRTKEFILLMKLCVGLMCISLCFFVVIVGYPDIGYAVALACAAVGFTGFSVYPLGLELGVECSFPSVPETTSTGFILISGQLQGIIYLVMTELLQRNIDGTKNVDLKVPLVLMESILVFFGVVFILFFNTEYKRRKAELIEQLDRILGLENSSTSAQSATIPPPSVYS